MNRAETITLPDGYNGHTVRFYREPVERNNDQARLRCADPGKDWILIWYPITYLNEHGGNYNYERTDHHIT